MSSLKAPGQSAPLLVIHQPSIKLLTIIVTWLFMRLFVLCLHTLQDQALCLAQFLAHRVWMNEWRVSTHLISFQPYINSLDAPAAGMTIYTLETTRRIPKFREVASLSRPSSKWWGRHFSLDLLTPNPVFLSSALWLISLTPQLIQMAIFQRSSPPWGLSSGRVICWPGAIFWALKVHFLP